MAVRLMWPPVIVAQDIPPVEQIVHHITDSLGVSSNSVAHPKLRGGWIMFERLFRQSRALNPHLNGPLAQERRRFRCHRAEQGYGRRGLAVLAYYLLGLRLLLSPRGSAW